MAPYLSVIDVRNFIVIEPPAPFLRRNQNIDTITAESTPQGMIETHAH
jgi:hypothetical protein